MSLGLNNLTLAAGSKKKTRRVGRGSGSGRGTYSGRGLKGQRARSGSKRGLKRRGLSQLLKSKPKIGGFRSLQPKMAIININKIDNNFADGEVITAERLLSKNLIKTPRNGLKVLGDGKITKKFTIIANAFSESAKKAIMEAGGKVQTK